MFSNNDSEIIEGFICPICKSDEKTAEDLLRHFEDEHSEEKDLISTFRDVFKSAKKKILNLDEKEFTKAIESSLSISKSIVRVDFKEPQNIGVLRDHFEYFKAIRNPRLERYATETNKLIIRLNKLLTNRPTDPQQIKQHEQNLVPWIDGKLVKLCPSCAKSFFFTRRQHHCRLCGSIMCNECSNFLSIDESMSIINPSHEVPQPESNTDVIIKEPEDTIRMCEHCLHLLETRKEMQDGRLARPFITKLYERIETLKKEVMPDIAMYEKIIKSLYKGDSIYTIADASALRGKIGSIAELLDDLSKKALTLKAQQGSREEALHKSLRMAAIKFIKEYMLELPQIPVEDEIKKIQHKRVMELNQKIERDRRLAQEAFEKYDLIGDASYPATSSKTGSALRTVDNWSGYQEQNQSNANDPLIIQINIVKGYIKQAREAMRFEEIESLEANLKELQHEYWLKTQQN
ncbi:rabenosyn-5 [Chironomus tepperi]|uniref:rabenosyn-5 n=1 Tax=Chironomus tepperi TaxID=113505 RepID=UPI00391F22EB